MPERSGHFGELDSVRALAAVLVICSHLPAWNATLHAWPLFREGGLMVDLFFVLSGFVIQTTYGGGRVHDLRSLAQFQLLRFGRLYPVHALFLAVFVVITWLRHSAAQQAGIANPNEGITAESGLSAFLQHVFLLQAVLPLGDILTFNEPSWSISVEFYVYLLFGLVALAMPRARALSFIAVHLVGVALIVSGVADKSLWLVRGISGFFLGCAVASLCTRLRAGTPWFVSELLCMALLGLLWLRLPAPWRYLAMQWLSAVLIGAIVLRRADRIGPCARLLQQPWLVAAGALSYTLYMSHAAVLWFANQFARFVLKWPLALAEGSYKPQADLLPAMALAGGTMLAVFAVAASVTRWVEVPARQRFRRWAASLDRRQQPEALRQNRVPGA